MKRLIIVLFGSCLIFSDLSAQNKRFIIQFRDKQGTPHSISNPASFLSARAIARRTRYNIAIDSSDLPITPSYLQSVANVPNVILLNISKWLNQVAIYTDDPAAITAINSFPFVKSVASIAAKKNNNTIPPDDKFFIENNTSGDIQQNLRINHLTTTALDYGQSLNQVHIHNGEFLHDRGFQGEGMVLAILDGGYSSYKTNPAFDSIRMNNQVLGEWDFVNNAANTDAFTTHGMNCLSTIASNRPGIMVGTAPHAKFWLFVTEDVASEYPVEEQNWAAAAEYADSSGADIISSSLGYQDFDDPSFDHLYAERDGNTSIVTRAADLAARKGMIIMNSAGNYGALPDQRKYISCPADGDSVVAVGAVNANGVIASFSSWGPNAKGKIKPNIVSVGEGTVVMGTNGNPFSGNGTSFSNPNIAGLVTCLWGAYPEYSNMQIIDAVQRSASKFSNPDDRFGYGIPDMRKAYYILKADKSQKEFGGTGWFRATPDPFTNQVTASFVSEISGTVKLYFKNINGMKIDSATFTVDSLDVKTHQFQNLDPLPGGFYYVEYKSNTKDSTISLHKGDDLLQSDWIKLFPNPFKEQLNLYFKAQLTGNIVISFYDTHGSLIDKKIIQAQQDNIYYADFPVAAKLDRGVYIINFNDGKNKLSFRVVR